MADLPIGIDKVPDQMHGSYLANYGAQRKEMSQDEMIAYYNNWAKQGKYENVKTFNLNCGIYRLSLLIFFHQLDNLKSILPP